MNFYKYLNILFCSFFVTLPTWADNPPKLPSGPDGPGTFGAYYTRLQFEPDWDNPWRVADHPDVIVRFADGGHKLVFWRGTSYIPCWVTDKGVWYTNEFVERRGHHSPNTEGCVEPMSDKQCRFSHVRIIESNAVRVVVHWRYAPVDVFYEHPFIDEKTGWSDWVDEYYTIYANAVGVRKITVHTTRPDLWTEFQESIVVNQPGTMPDDNIEPGAVSVANMKGESKTYYWSEEGGPEFNANPAHANIIKINLKGSLKPFAVVAPNKDDGTLITAYEGHGRNSRFNWWDHWPVSQDASDGRGATTVARPSHSSLCHIGLPGMATAEWQDYARGDNWRTKIMMNGMTGSNAADLANLAKTWLYPADLKINGEHFKYERYDPAQMAFLISSANKHQKNDLTFTVYAGPQTPLINPAFVIKGWGQHSAHVKINGKQLSPQNDFRITFRNTLESTDLLVWINNKFLSTVKFEVFTN